MADFRSAIRDTVPISQFTRGSAEQIFEEVNLSGAKVVMKNNEPVCVLLSPEEYARLMDEVNDASLLAIALQRLENCDPKTLLSDEEMNARLGIRECDLADFEKVELE